MLASESQLELRPLLATTALSQAGRPDVCGAQIFCGHPANSPWYADATSGVKCDRLGASLFPRSAFVHAAVARDGSSEWLVRVAYRGEVPPAAAAKAVAVMDDFVLAPATICARNSCPPREVTVDIRGHYTFSEAAMTAALLNSGPLPVDFITTTWDRSGKTETCCAVTQR
ncbi:MAG TPA: hypothetical protein VGO03_01705 [Acidimicrobiia bacterium]|jgi:hypothetical protein